MVKAVDDGTYAHDGRKTVGEWLGEWLAEKVAGTPPNHRTVIPAAHP